MFAAEYVYLRQLRKSIEKGREELVLDQRHWRTDEPGPAEGLDLPPRAIYAQNDAYLELCNPGWDMQWRATFGNVFMLLPMLFVIWAWYGFAISPLLFGRLIAFWEVFDYEKKMWPLLLLGWLIAFPLAIGAAFLIYGWFIGMGMRTCWFTGARGRIRFNRLTRKVYVLRPNNCGGNQVFEWERLVALMRRVPEDRAADSVVGALVLYHAPRLADGSDEDAIFVGPSLYGDRVAYAAAQWEYIRLYMEQGPTVDEIPADAPADFKQVPRYLPHAYSTYCGLPSDQQYRLEQLLPPGFGEVTCHMISQATCSWLTFPKEWQSDSGLGEPEDKPVQTGAVMTALVYRAEGKLSAEDEVTFMTHWGTPEGLAEAQERLGREQG